MPRTEATSGSNPPAGKRDLKKELPTYSAVRGVFEVVTVPALQFLMIDGLGDPNTATSYRDALQTVYPVAWTLKFLSRTALGRDHVVMPLEALWWADDLASFTAARDTSLWHWTVMIMVPDWITAEHLDTAVGTVEAKRGAPALDLLRLETLDEGVAVQTLHLGPYDDEGPVLREMHDDFLPTNGFRPVGRHHEIYLSDARRTAPARLRTILRQPVVATDSSR